MLPIRKILCPTDFSEASYEGLKAANELAVHFSATLAIVHAIAPISTGIGPAGVPPAAPPTPAAYNVASHQKELEDSSRTSLQEVVDRRVSSDLKTQQIIVHGSAADEIVRVADEENADLIVIATHGQTGWRRLVFGSVAEKVVRLASRSVLTVPAPKEANE